MASAALNTAFENAKKVEKFDVLYMQTPYHRLTADELKDLPLEAITKSDSTLFLWTDSSNAATAMRFIDAQGFKFRDIAAIVDIAEHQQQQQQQVVSADDAEKGSTAKKTRVKTIQPFPWWSGDAGTTLSRHTTEQLWMATKGEGCAVNGKYKPAPFQVQTYPEFSKAKAKGRQSISDEWNCKRPDLLQQVINMMATGSRVLDIFGDSLHANAAILSPALATGFVSAMSSHEGHVQIANDAIGPIGRVQLRSLAAKLRRSVSPAAASAAAASAAAGTEEGETTDPAAVEAAAVSDLEPSVVELMEKVAPHFENNTANRRLLSAIADYRMTVVNRSRKGGKRHAKELLLQKSSNGASSGDDADATTAVERKKHGIAEKGRVSKELCAFLELPEGSKIARTETVSLISKYINKHNLKKEGLVHPDAKIKKFYGDENLQPTAWFKLCSNLLNPHFKARTTDDFATFMHLEEPKLPKIEAIQLLQAYAEEKGLVQADGVHPDGPLVQLYGSSDVIPDIAQSIDRFFIKPPQRKKRSLAQMIEEVGEDGEDDDDETEEGEEDVEGEDEEEDAAEAAKKPAKRLKAQ